MQNKMRKIYLISITLIITLMSCNNNDNDEFMDYYIKNFEPELSVSGFASTDSIYVCLTKTKKCQFYYNNTYPNYDSISTDTTATISLYEDNNFLCLLKPKSYGKQYDYKSDKWYTKNYYVSYRQIKKGSTYSIKINHKTFGLLQATTYIPRVPVVTFDSTSVLSKISYFVDETCENICDTNMWNTIFTVSINDLPNSHNYYMLEIINNIVPLEHMYLTTNYNFDFNDIAIEFEFNRYQIFPTPRFVFSDKLFDGKNYKMQFSCLKECADSVSVNLYSISEDYYKYYMSIGEYEEAKYDPFSKPIFIYSNVNNQLGIFGGYTKQSFKNY